MALSKIYNERINWQNEPTTSTPLNATNLNKMDSALYEIDSRIVSIDTQKANQSDLLTAVKNVSFNNSTGVIKFKYFDDTEFIIDLNVEKIPAKFSLSDEGVLTMETDDGTKFTANVQELIKQNEFNNTPTISIEDIVNSSGNHNIKANIIKGSIDETHLKPTYLATINSQVESSIINSTLSKSYAVGDTDNSREGEDTDNAKYYSELAGQYAEQSKGFTPEGYQDLVLRLSNINVCNVQKIQNII